MSFERKKVLVIDDEPSIGRTYIKVLIECGFVARWAGDAQTALNILIREDVNLVLLDIKMPGIDGKTMFEVIQEYDPLMKVVVSSVYPIDRQKELVPGAQDYFDKSQGLTVLLEKTANALFEPAAEMEIRKGCRFLAG